MMSRVQQRVAAARRSAPRDSGVAQKCAPSAAIETRARSRPACLTSFRSRKRAGRISARSCVRLSSWVLPRGISELRGSLARHPASPSRAHLLLRLVGPAGELAGDVEALLDEGAIAEGSERLCAPEGAVDRTLSPGPDESAQVRFPRIHPCAARSAGRLPDGYEGIAHGDHAFPATAPESGAVGVLPDSHGFIDMALRELLVDDGEIRSPGSVVSLGASREAILQPVELLVYGRADAEQYSVLGSGYRQFPAVGQDDAESQKRAREEQLSR